VSVCVCVCVCVSASSVCVYPSCSAPLCPGFCSEKPVYLRVHWTDVAQRQNQILKNVKTKILDSLILNLVFVSFGGILSTCFHEKTRKTVQMKSADPSHSRLNLQGPLKGASGVQTR